MERNYTFNQLIEIASLAKAWVKPFVRKQEEGAMTVYGKDPINGKSITMQYKTLKEHKKPKQKREICVDGINCEICRRKLLGRYDEEKY